MKDPYSPAFVKQFTPQQLGWKRRDDLRFMTENIVWELPDGRFYMTPKGQRVCLEVLCVED